MTFTTYTQVCYDLLVSVAGCSVFGCYPPDFFGLWQTEGQYDARFDQNPGRLSLRKQMKLKCQEQKLAVAGTNIDQGVLTLRNS